MVVLIITNGRVIDPANNIDGQLDVIVEDGRIVRVGSATVEERSVEGVELFDATGLIVTPGLIDM